MSEYDYDKAPTNPHHGGKMTPTDMVRRIEELEANLAKAVAQLEETNSVLTQTVGQRRHKAWATIRKTNNTLVELTGGKDE